MKKYLLNFLPLLLIASLISSFNVTNSYAQNFSLKLESQPVCLDSLKSVWQEFGSPFPCFTSGSLIELSKPVPGRDKTQGELYFKLNEVVKLVSSPNLILTTGDYNLGLNKAYFYTKDLSTNEEKLFGSPFNFIIYNSMTRQRAFAEPKKNYTIVLKDSEQYSTKKISDLNLMPVSLSSVDAAGNKTEFKSRKIFTADLDSTELENLEENNSIKSLSPSSFVYLNSVQTNPPSWGLDRIDQDSLPLDAKYKYGAITGSDVVAYIIDTGLNMSHSEFSGKIIKTAFIDDLGSANDCNGHGTHVAGTILGTNYGVAKNAKVIPIKVFGCSGGAPSSWIQSAMEYAISDHETGIPAVVNMSLGGGENSTTDGLVQEMIDDGLVVVVAAGNSSDNACLYSPARAPNAITVGSTTDQDIDSSFSNIGPCVDIFAPGSGIKSAWIGSSSATATISGTSMAAPHVAGVAALVLERDYSSYEYPEDANYSVLSTITTNASEDILGPCCGEGEWWASTPNLFLKSKFLFSNSLVNVSVPTISGTIAINQTITTSNGDWTGSPAPTFSYQWFLCENDEELGACTAINGATARTLKLTTPNIGKNVRIRITATNSLTSQSVFSLASSEVASPPTVTTPAFTITGTAAVGQSLTYTDASVWNAYPTVTPTYQVYRCTRAVSATKVLNTNPLANCTAISGETTSPYTLQSDDSGKFITVAATGTNTGGTLVIWAKSTTAVGSIPANSPAPTITSSTGSFGVGATITATSTAAQWTGSPVPKLTFQWQKYVDSSWVAITGATRNTFKLTANETGFKVRIAVTGTNTYGATVAYSDESASEVAP